ncbi:unnamed protein product [Closterium sp. NIES-54]
MGVQRLGAVDDATGDDTVPTPDRQEARTHAGTCVGLHGVVLGPRAAARWEAGAESSLGTAPGGVAGEQGLGGRSWKPPERLIFRACLPPAAFHMLLNDAEADVDLPKLDLDVHADPNHRWDIATTIVKEALASWKGKAVKAAMDEETRSLIGMGTWSWSNARAVHDELYFKVSDDRVTCSVLVDVDDLLAPSSSTAMPKELKELLEAAFELCEILPVEKYLGLEIMCDTPSRKVWLHQQSYANKLRRRFINEEQTGRIPKTPVFVDACANLTFDIEDAQAREEEEYRKNFGLDDEAGNGLHPQQAGEQSHLEDVRD